MPIGLSRPPLPPPPVMGQTGMPPGPDEPGPPSGGLSNIAQKMGGQDQGGQPNPHGFVLAQVDAVKKVLEQIARTEPVMAPFAQQASQALENGIAAVNAAPTATPEGSAPLPPGPGNPGASGPSGAAVPGLG